jgi:hypothetical protein
MRRGGTVLVVVVVAAIGLAAGLDALRGDSGTEQGARTEPEEPSVSTPTTPESSPSAEPFGGVLYYTDERCQLRAAQLPDLEPADAPNWDECPFVLSPDGQRVSGAGSGWDPHSDPRRGRLFQSENGRIQVSTNGGPEGEAFRGEAPAWRPDGTLTYFGDGAVREWPTNRVVFSAAELVGAAMTHFNAPRDRRFIRRIRVKHLAWLDQEHAVLAIHGVVPQGADLDFAAVSEDGRLPTTVDTFAPITALWTSPQGGFWAIAADTFQLFAPSGDNLPLPQLTDPHAVTWSPDDRQMAVATRASVFFFPPGETDSVRRLPLVAGDLDWRGEVGPPPLVDVDEVRDWLGRVGGTGRLFVAVPGCRLRALRLPDLVWEEEPDVAAPCRFTLAPDDTPLDEAVSVSPTDQLRAICDAGGLRVFDTAGLRAQLPGACGTAWMGDGTLTFLRNGGLWQGVEDPHQLVSREQVSEIFGRPSALEEIAWVDDERFWAVVRSGETAIVALIIPDGLAFSPSFTTRVIEGLRVSATGMVAARTDQGVVLFDSGGRRTMTFPNGRAVAWAPGELVAAVATPSEILFVAPVSREVVSLPLEVSDLEWVVP